MKHSVSYFKKVFSILSYSELSETYDGFSADTLSGKAHPKKYRNQLQALSELMAEDCGVLAA